MTGTCIVFTGPERVGFGEITLAEPGPGQLLTRTIITGVSTGTETRVFRGKQAGAVFPLIPGYENIGEVIAKGPGTTTPIGARVFVRNHAYESPGLSRSWGSQVSHSLTAEGSVVAIPESLDSEVAIFAKVSAISLHGVKRARVAAGERVVVMGLGLIGHLVVQHAVAAGAKVIGVDVMEDRLELAAEAGAAHVVNASHAEAESRVLALTDGGADVAFDATGRADTLEKTARLLRKRPWDGAIANVSRLVIQGTLEEPVIFDYFALFMPEIDVVIPRDCDTADVREALSSMATGATNPALIPAGTFPYRQAPEVYPRLVGRELMRAHFTWG